jgi:antitoxin ParD1/3/4
MDVSLTPELEQFIENLVEKGSYAPSSEVVRSGLRLLVKHESAHLKLQDLLQAAEEDFRAGRVQSFANTDGIYAEIRRHVETRRTNK